MPDPILFPSGEDCNPLNRRLPAEVVTRRPRIVRKVEPEKDSNVVEVDLRTATSLKPDKRLIWLTKACKMAEDGKTSAAELFNLVTTKRFASGVGTKVGTKMWDSVNGIIGLFSDKQQRYLRSDEWALSSFENKGGADADDGDPAADEDDIEEEKEEPADSREDPPPERPRGSAIDDGARGTQRVPVNPGGSSGGWVSMARGKEDREQREILEFEGRRKARARDREEQNRWLAESDQRVHQQQQAKKKQLEDEVDSSLQMLEMFTQRREPSPRRSSRKDRSRRGLSRSRSISVRREPSPRKEKKAKKMDRVSFEEALRQRMADRDRSDTTRAPVVDPGHAQRNWT